MAGERRGPGPVKRGANRIVLAVCLVATVGMVGMAYAAVPLYRAFCQATGFNGTVKRQEAAGFRPIARRIAVRFDTNVRGLPWTFRPEQSVQTVQMGRAGLAYFKVRNDGATALTGRAAYNLAPESAGAYFVKTQCFCFNDQTIAAGKTVTFPVIYYVDPKFAADPDTRPFQEIVLSYTFFPSTAANAAKG